MTATHSSPPGSSLSGRQLAALGVFVLSFDALLVRLAAGDVAMILFWRGGLTALVLGGLSWLRGWPRGVGRPLLATGLILGVDSVLFVVAIHETGVAQALVLVALSPLMAALLARPIVGERLALRTWLAILLVMATVIWIFVPESELRFGRGEWAALGAAFLMGLNLNLFRRWPQVPRVPAVALAGLVTAVLALPFATFAWPGAVPAAAMFGMGAVQIPLAFVLLTTATRRLPAAEVALWMLLETVLGPFWVWAILGEPLPLRVLAGGLAILAVVAWHARRT